MLVPSSLKAGLGVLLAILLGSNCFATSLVVVVTPGGTVFASDTGVTASSGNLVPNARAGTHVKLKIIQNRIVIASSGIFSMKDPKTMKVQYDFDTWIGEIIKTLPSNISVDDFAGLIEKKSATPFRGLSALLANGTIRNDNPLDLCRNLLEYVIVGYDAGVSKVYDVKLDVIWDQSRIVGPTKILMHPVEGQGQFQVWTFGNSAALDDLGVPSSYAFKKASARCHGYSDIIKSFIPPLKPTEGIARAYIAAEEDISPGKVFGDISTVTITPDQGASSIGTASSGDLGGCATAQATPAKKPKK